MLILGHDLVGISSGPPGKKQADLQAGRNLLRPLPRPEIAGRRHGGILTRHREIREPDRHLPGLRCHHVPARQPGQDRPEFAGKWTSAFRKHCDT